MSEAFIKGVKLLDTFYNGGMRRLMMLIFIVALEACSTSPGHRAEDFGEHLASQASHYDMLYYDFDNDGVYDDYHF